MTIPIPDPIEPIIDAPIEAATDVTEAISDAVETATGAVEAAAVDSIETLSEAFKIQAGTLATQNELITGMVGTLNGINDRLAQLAERGVETAADVTEAVADVPAETVETIDAVIEGEADKPRTHKRKMLGKKRR